MDDIRDEFDPPPFQPALAAARVRARIKRSVASNNRRTIGDAIRWIAENPRVGKWTISSLAAQSDIDRNKRVHVRCDCGAEHTVLIANLKSGRSTQCASCGRRARKKTK